MAGDRRFSQASDKRKASSPYNTDRPKSFRDRIDTADDRKPIVFPGRETHHTKSSQPASQKSRDLKNPLYAYINGTKTVEGKGEKTQTPREHSRRRETTSPVSKHRDHKNSSYIEPRTIRLPAPQPGFNIKGLGAINNTFSFRGASSTSVSIKNLAPGTTQADVCTILNESIGEVEECSTFPVKGGISTTAEVRFGSRVAADKAINMLHGVLADNKRLDVSILLMPDNAQTDSRSAHRNTIDKSSRGPTSHPSEDVDMHELVAQRDDRAGRGQSLVESKHKPTEARNLGKRDLFEDRQKHQHTNRARDDRGQSQPAVQYQPRSNRY